MCVDSTVVSSRVGFAAVGASHRRSLVSSTRQGVISPATRVACREGGAGPIGGASPRRARARGRLYSNRSAAVGLRRGHAPLLAGARMRARWHHAGWCFSYLYQWDSGATDSLAAGHSLIGAAANAGNGGAGPRRHHPHRPFSSFFSFLSTAWPPCSGGCGRPLISPADGCSGGVRTCHSGG